MDDLKEIKAILEAALLTAGEPVAVTQLARLFEPAIDAELVRKVLDELKDDWSARSVELVQVASGWRFQGKPSIQPFLDRLSPERPPRYSRAAMETLAIIAYQQPVTRGEIEAIRGVAVSTSVITALLTVNGSKWSHKETPTAGAYATPRPSSTISACARCPSCPRWPSSTLPTRWRCPMHPPKPPKRNCAREFDPGPSPTGPMQQPSLACRASRRAGAAAPPVVHDEIHRAAAAAQGARPWLRRAARWRNDRRRRITVNREPPTSGSIAGDEVRINGELVKVRFAELRAGSSCITSPRARSSPATIRGRPTVPRLPTSATENGSR
jgi:segregation and condensation protein B